MRPNALAAWARAHPEPLRALAVTAIGLAIVALYAFPGFMAWDSVEQLAMARSGTLTDWHPPLMSALWGLLDRVVEGPALMLALQCTLFLVGLYALLRRRLSPWRAAIATLAIFAWPPSLTIMAVIVKDALMCGALLAGCAALTSARRGWRLGGLAAFLLAAGLRHNAIAAVVPLLAWLCPWPASRPRWLRALAGTGIGLALTLAALLANRALTDVPTHPFHYSVATMDIVGTLHFAPDTSDDEIRALMPGVRFARAHGLQQQAHELYDTDRWWGSLIYGDARLFDEPATDELRDAVAAAWWRLVRTFPGAYATSRLDMTRVLLGLDDRPYRPVYAARQEWWMYKGTFQIDRPRNVVQRWLSSRLDSLGRDSVTFRPYAYLVLALALAIVLRRDRIAVALLASGAAYVALLVVAMPAPDFRYTHWLIVAVMTALAYRLGAISRSGAPGA